MSKRQRQGLGAIAPDRAPVKFSIPSHVEILDQRWRVDVCDPWSDSGVVGHCDLCDRTIKIANNIDPGLTIEVFIHELLHAMIAASGCRVDCDSEEHLISTLAPMIWDTFRRNKLRLV